MSNVQKNLVASCIGTTVAEMATLPICTIKTLTRPNGLKSFYKASVPAILAQTYSTSSKYVLYRYLEDLNLEYTNKSFNGIAAGLASTVITHPLDTIKIHQQMNKSFVQELKHTGPRLFFRGYSKTFSKILVSSALFFPLYDYYMELFGKHSIIAGFCSATTSTVIMHPIDYLKTRHIYNLPLYQGLNPLIYYKGLTLNLLRIVPHFMITMSVIEYVKKM